MIKLELGEINNERIDTRLDDDKSGVFKIWEWNKKGKFYAIQTDKHVESSALRNEEYK